MWSAFFAAVQSKGDYLMFSNKVQAIILAAGKSTRFNTGRTKLLEKICGQEMILYSTRLLESFNIPISVVIGYQKDSIKETIIARHSDAINFVIQDEQKGTGHAIMCTQDIWHHENILVMNGDAPLVTKDIIEKLYEKHVSTNAQISFVTSHHDVPDNSYGRVIESQNSLQIIEARDFQGDISEHCCINAGIYLIRKTFLEKCIKDLVFHETSKEFYITDLIKIASDQQLPVSMVPAPFDRIRGINNLQELWAAEHIKRADLIKHWMEHGVHFSVAQNVHIDLNVSIGAGSYIGCGVHLLGNTQIGKNSRVQEFSSLDNTIAGENTNILPHTIVENSKLGNNTKIGPFAYVHDHSQLGDNVVIGNFVEVKKSIFGAGTKALHMSYLGDAQIGQNVTIGAGTITCNHNSMIKHKTIIRDNAYIGSNNTLVAPVIIGQEAFTAAGSVITENVPDQSLAIARARQINKEGYATGASHSAFIAATKTHNEHSSDAS
jgi:bifunctional UDP-N-acetylglucosamine pyrophosphorylase/glucosamine-1-phosphate N-acetyltransferase